MNIEGLFPNSYIEARERFRRSINLVREYWPDATLQEYALNEFEDLTIDWIRVNGRQKTEKLLMFTTGEHGIEGYVGSALLEYFFRNYLHLLDPSSTGLLIVHAIDPWGMKYMRRTNPYNVDLNRNFVWQREEFDPQFNPEYAKMASFFSPPHPVNKTAKLSFLLKYIFHTLRIGSESFWETRHLGQYKFPKGIHYGAETIQEEVYIIRNLYRQAFDRSRHILLIDIHTGYGPRYQMTLVNSLLENQSSTQLSKKIGYPLVAATNTDEFYPLHGDMIDYVYKLREVEFPYTKLYATSFEFGTCGDSKAAKIHGLRTMILENQCYHYGATPQKISGQIRTNFRELFFPSEFVWREKAVKDCDQAFRGILNAEGFINI
jgi:hypothetical protein